MYTWVYSANLLYCIARHDTYLHPSLLLTLNNPATILEITIPIVINSWLIVTSRPRISAGAASATYTGIDMEANPENTKCRS